MAKQTVVNLEPLATHLDKVNSNFTELYDSKSDENFTTILKTKLDGIEALADVTDATNVDAAGAVMNSDYGNHSILVKQGGSGDPISLSVGTNTIVGRLSGGGSDIDDLSTSQVKTMLDLAGNNTGDETLTTIQAKLLTATTKSSLVNADQFGIFDSAASNVFKRLTWSTLKTEIKSWYDSITSTLTNKTINGVNNTLTNLSINAPEGFLINGQIVRTVASGNLTIAIKTLAGADPSATDPVYCRIGNTVRTLTSALSVTTNAGTNWFNSGSTELATQEIDYFVYLTYRTASTNIQLGISRISHAVIYSDFSTTNTNEKFAAFSTAPASTDEVENIGRFNATLSAGAGFTWSIPATSIIINRPIFETRYLTFVPTISFIDGTAPSSPSTVRHRYKIVGDTMIVACANEYGTAGTGNSVITVSLPFNENTIFSTSGLFGYLFIGGGSGYGASNGASAQCRGRLVRVIGSSMNSNGWVIGGQINI